MHALLVAPPLAEPTIPNLAIELLAAAARAAGHGADTLHGALRQPRNVCRELIHGLVAPVTFAASYYGTDPIDVAEEAAEAMYDDFGKGLPSERRGPLTDALLFGANDASQCVDSILEEIDPGRYDVIGFSIGFDAQKLAAAAIARALRGRGERSVLVAGGTGCDGPMGAALLERFSEFDVVLQGEADQSWILLLERLAAGRPLDDVPGCVFRRGPAVVTVPEAPVGTEFLEFPLPDYTSFLSQRARSPYRDSRLCLLFETSRGCWWGRRRHCSFCGIRSVDGDYRVRDAPAALHLVTTLQGRYHPDVLYSTDAIAPSSYDDDLWPALAAERRAGAEWMLFYELKSNITRAQAARLAAAGVTQVQPGIESFSSRVLRLMGKGATALQQVAFLKWARTYGITPTYGIIVGTPGETADDLSQICRVIERIPHLPPPVDVHPLALHRFSPYFDDPSAFGIRHVRPFAVQRVIYRCSDDLLRRLCYELNFCVPDQETEEIRNARAEVVDALSQWKVRHAQGTALWVRSAANLRIIARFDAAGPSVEVIGDPTDVFVLDSCAEVTSVAGLLRRSDRPEHAVRASLEQLAERGLVLLADGCALSLPAVAGADAHADATASVDRQPPEQAGHRVAITPRPFAGTRGGS